jgi:hypothetical protein
MDRLYISSMVHRERRILSKGGTEWIYAAAPNRPPYFPWLEFPEGQAFFPPLLPKATYLDRDDLVALLTTRGGPLQGCGSRQAAHVLSNPARTARLGFLLCLRAVRMEDLSGPATEIPTVPAMRTLADYQRWRESCREDRPRGTQRPRPERPYEPSTFSRSLTLVTLGSLGMQLQFRCERCFRVAGPSLKRCPAHSRSDAADVDGGPSNNQRRSAARSGERIVELLGDIGPPRDLGDARLLRASQLSGALLDMPLGDLGDWQRKVDSSLLAAPHVRPLLPATFTASPARTALRALRHCLDPLEYDPWAWPEKIRLANAWIGRHKEVAQGKPPSGPRARTLTRMAEVRDLRAQGLDDAAIAARLKISVRALRLTFKRHGKG